jgi:hypothetical protein
MFCPTCGAENSATRFCGQCGQAIARENAQAAHTAPPVPPVLERAVARGASPPFDLRLLLAGGFIAGGFIGFLSRPSVFLVGQLPFRIVITRGSGLSGLDELLIPSAQESFNVMVIGALVGAAIAFAATRMFAKASA